MCAAQAAILQGELIATLFSHVRPAAATSGLSALAPLLRASAALAEHGTRVQKSMLAAGFLEGTMPIIQDCEAMSSKPATPETASKGGGKGAKGAPAAAADATSPVAALEATLRLHAALCEGASSAAAHATKHGLHAYLKTFANANEKVVMQSVGVVAALLRDADAKAALTQVLRPSGAPLCIVARCARCGEVLCAGVA